MNEEGVLSSWRKWRTDTEKNYYNPNHKHNNFKYKEDPQCRYHHVTATVSRSDPESTMRCIRKPSYEDFLEDRLVNSTNHNNRVLPSSSNRAPACKFRATNFSRGNSFSDGFIHEDDEEPTDTLVWNSRAIPNNHTQRSPSQTSQERRHSSSPNKTTMMYNPTLAMSQSIKSLNLAKLGQSNDDDNFEYEDQMAGVTKQLEMIKSTQDSILSELSSDISNLQFENVQLKNTNEHLTVQNSHLLQVINDLSKEVELMRQVFRNRGWPMQDSNSIVNEFKPPSKSNHSMRKSKSQTFKNGVFTIKGHQNENTPFQLNDDDSAYESQSPGDDQVYQLSNPSRDSVLPRKSKAKEKIVEEKEKSGCFGMFKKKKKRDRKKNQDE